MNNGMQRNWQKLAREMTSSFTPDRAVLVKRMLLNQRRTQIKRRRIAMGASALLLFVGSIGVIATDPFHKESSGKNSSPAIVAAEPMKKEPKAPVPPKTNDPKGVQGESPRAMPLSAGTRFSVEENLSTSSYHIETGIVRFETRKSHVKKLQVHVGDLLIEDIGTIFTVETVSGREARVSVTEGRVKVTWPSGGTELSAGTEEIFPLKNERTGKRNTRKSRTSIPQGNTDDWRYAARKGQNHRALALIDSDPARVRHTADDLLLAADVMRLTGHPIRAKSYLEQVIHQFKSDTRRASAAFALGKVLLDELKKPKQAAKAFAIAARKNSLIAEEAAAREVEAWSRAGDPERTYAAAMRYLQKYPHGARANAVKALGAAAQ